VDEEIIIIGGLITFGIAIGMVCMTWAARLPLRRRRGAATSRLAAVEDRLARLEDSVNTVAIEMERIAEAHRFTARVLSERLDALPAPRQSERLSTPH
jgi:hypothetical protein